MTVALGLAGCGSSDPQGQARSKVREFARAAAAHDYATICHDVLAPTLMADFARGGINCRQALSVALGGLRDLHLTVGPAKVSGNSATVLTISQASGQKTVLSSLHLVRTGHGWRIDSLGSPTG